MTTILDRLNKSAGASDNAERLIEQAPDGPTQRALSEALVAIGYMRRVMREQQGQIAELRAQIDALQAATEQKES